MKSFSTGGEAYTRCSAPSGAIVSCALKFVPGHIVIGWSYHTAAVKVTANRGVARASQLHQQRYLR